jgi:L-ribulokinase
MGRINLAVHTPDEKRADAYDLLFTEYRALHDHFGRGGSDALHRLRALRDAARTAAQAAAGTPGTPSTPGTDPVDTALLLEEAR